MTADPKVHWQTKRAGEIVDTRGHTRAYEAPPA
jgi:hypothetical protein